VQKGWRQVPIVGYLVINMKTAKALGLTNLVDCITGRSPGLHLPMIAAPLAAAAALGSFAGSLTASGVTQFWPHVGPSSSNVAASDAQASNVELAVLSAPKAYVEGASRNANHQFATLADRLDRIERTRAEPNVKLARIAEAVDRLEKQRKSAMAAVAAPAAAAPEITGTVKLITFDARNLGASHIE
jgi:hypothetical protein